MTNRATTCELPTQRAIQRPATVFHDRQPLEASRGLVYPSMTLAAFLYFNDFSQPSRYSGVRAVQATTSSLASFTLPFFL